MNDAQPGTPEPEPTGVALELLPDPVLLFDAAGGLMYANLAARARFALPASPERLPAAAVLQGQPELLALLDAPEPAFPAALQVRFPDAKSYAVQLARSPSGCLVSLHDVSPFHQRSITDRAFMHALGHDLRSPLTSIIGYVELLGRVGELNDIQRDFIARVTGSVQQINSQVNDLVLLADCEDCANLPRQPVPLDQLIARAAAQREKQLAASGLALQVDALEPLTVLGVPVLLEALLHKLLENAILSTPSGGEITVRLSLQPGHAVIQVCDGGPSIRPDEQELIFTHFYRGSHLADSSRTTGLGLAIARTAARAHGGELTVSSTPGSGSIFTAWLPLAPGGPPG